MDFRCLGHPTDLQCGSESKAAKIANDTDQWCTIFLVAFDIADENESTAGADASVEALKLYNMKLAPVVEIYLLWLSSSYKKWEMIDRDLC